MKVNEEAQARLHRLIAARLNEQPSMQAPSTLQSRVWAQLERRAALPWWHRSFRHWPVSMRVAFVLTALAVVWLVLNVMAGFEATGAVAQLAAPVSEQLTWLQHLAAVFAMLGSLCGQVSQELLNRIPGMWLYGAVAVLIAMYAMLAGIGVAAYRTLEGAGSRA